MKFQGRALKAALIWSFAVIGFSFGEGLLAAEAAKPGEGAGHEYDGAPKQVEAEELSKESLLPAKLYVDETKLVRRYDAALFGVCYDWWAINALDIAKPEEPGGIPQVSRDYLELMKGVPLTLNRNVTFPMSWKDALGPMSERKSQKLTHWDKGSVKAFGPVEWIKSTLATDPSAEFVWCLDIGRADNAQDAHDIAEFLTGSASSVWGAKRVALGIEKPVKVAIWELGNELDWSSQKMSLERYVELSKAAIAAVRSVQPDAVFAAHAATAPWHPTQSKNWLAWHRGLLESLGGEIGFLSLHPYYRGYSVSFIESYINQISSDIKASNHTNIKLYISEHGKWPPGDSSKPEWRKYWFQTHALVGCLDTAEWTLRMLARQDIAAMTYHNVSSGPWGMVYRDNLTQKLYSTAMADLFRVFAKVPFGSKVVASTLSGEETNPRSSKFSLSAAAMLSEDGKTLYLELCNHNALAARDLAASFKDGPYYPVSATVLSAPNMMSFDSAEQRPVRVEEEEMDGSQSFTGISIPAKSLVVLKLKRK